MTDQKFVQVQGNPHLQKDMHSGAVLNNDIHGLQVYKQQKRIAQEQQKRIAKLESDMIDMKAMLRSLLQGK